MKINTHIAKIYSRKLYFIFILFIIVLNDIHSAKAYPVFHQSEIQQTQAIILRRTQLDSASQKNSVQIMEINLMDISPKQVSEYYSKIVNSSHIIEAQYMVVHADGTADLL